MKTKEITEARLPDTEYKVTDKATTVKLSSHKSGIYTKLAQKIDRISTLESELKVLKAEVKADVRENVIDLFDAEDAARTRVVETVSFILTLSKDPKATETPKYKEILEALTAQLTPELITVLEGLKKQMVTVTQKAPGLKVAPISEGAISNVFAKVKAFVSKWGRSYDQKLDALKAQYKS